MNIEKIKNKIGMPRIMFLDIDGVLCTMRSQFAFGDNRGLMSAWDITCCQMIRSLCEKLNFKIVISSVWKNQNTVHQLRSHLGVYGLVEDLYEGKGERNKWFYGSEENSYEWRTKKLKYDPEKDGEHIRRGLEIQEWLNRHPLISDYIIIDDDSDMLKSQLSHFIHIKDGAEGFSSDNYMQILTRYKKRYNGKCN